MNTDTKKNYRTLTKCDSGKLYKVIEYDTGARVEIPVNQDGSIKWFDDSKLLKKKVPHYRLEELTMLCADREECKPDIFDTSIWFEITDISTLPAPMKKEFEDTIYKLLMKHYNDTHETIPHDNIEIDMCIRVEENSLVSSVNVFDNRDINFELGEEKELIHSTEFNIFRSYFYNRVNNFISGRMREIEQYI